MIKKKVFVIALMCSMLSACGSKTTPAVNEVEQKTETASNFAGIILEGVDIAGYTDEELKQLVKNKESDFANMSLTVKFDGKDSVYECTYEQLGAYVDYEKLETMFSGASGDINLPIEIDENKMLEIANTISEEQSTKPVNASMERVNNQFVISDGSDGLVYLVADICVAIEEGVQNREAEVTVAPTVTEPEYTKADIENSTKLIGSFYTSYDASKVQRNTNLKTASGNINGAILYPNEIFSTNKMFKETTAANGYVKAPVIVDGVLEDGFGGGVCQISSTLYNAVLQAELEVVERQNHSLKVAYTPYGMDATLAGDYIDFKFKNDTEYPIYIESYMDDNSGQAIVNIYGYEIHNPTRKLEFFSELVGTYPPEKDVVVEDPMKDKSYSQYAVKPLTGYDYYVYKNIYEDGVKIGTEKVNRSFYRPRQGQKVVGTKEATEVVKEEPKKEESKKEEPAPVVEPPVSTIIDDNNGNNNTEENTTTNTEPVEVPSIHKPAIENPVDAESADVVDEVVE